MQKFWGKSAEECVIYAENTLDYAKISAINKTDDEVRTTVEQKVLPTI